MSDDVKITFGKEIVIGPDADGPGPIYASRDCYGPGGMSLRDWFAGQAMAALIHQDLKDLWINVGDVTAMEVISSEAYLQADAMLDARKK